MSRTTGITPVSLTAQRKPSSPLVYLYPNILSGSNDRNTVIGRTRRQKIKLAASHIHAYCTSSDIFTNGPRSIKIAGFAYTSILLSNILDVLAN